jgi:methionine aminopeptidase
MLQQNTVPPFKRYNEQYRKAERSKGDFMAQHEHTVVVTNGKPIILTEMNEIWN